MNDVQCIGYETSIAYCQHRGYGCCNDCFHDEDVGVSCGTYRHSPVIIVRYSKLLFRIAKNAATNITQRECMLMLDSGEATTIEPVTFGADNTEQTTESPVELTTMVVEATTEGGEQQTGVTIEGGNTEEQTTEIPAEPTTMIGFTNQDATVGIVTFPSDTEETTMPAEESTAETTQITIESGGGEQTTEETTIEPQTTESVVGGGGEQTTETVVGELTTESVVGELTTEPVVGELTTQPVVGGGGEQTTEPVVGELTTELVVGGDITTEGPIICNCPNEEFQTTGKLNLLLLK